jgi:hypothetical protein
METLLKEWGQCLHTTDILVFSYLQTKKVSANLKSTGVIRSKMC